MLPIIVIACAVVFLLFQKGRDDQMQNLVGTARALSLALDRSFESAIATLAALAKSENLQAGDLRSFYDEARRFLAVREGTEAIMLIRSSGRQVIHTGRPISFGAEPMGDLDLVRRVVRSRSPQVGNLTGEGGEAVPVIPVAIPVTLRGEVQYALIMELAPLFVQRLLEQQKLPAAWLATVVDGEKRIVAGTRELGGLLGTPAGHALAGELTASTEGWWKGKIGDGKIYVAHRRSTSSGWTVALGVPVAVVNGRLWQAIGMIAGGMVLFLLTALMLAMVFARRIVSSINALASGAKGLAGGGSAPIMPSPVFELDQVRRELESAAGARRAMEASLRQSEARLRAIIDTEPECVKVVAPDGKLIEMNGAGLAMLQADSLQAVADKSVLDFVPPNHRKPFLELHQKVMNGESGELQFEVVGLKGRRRWLETRAAPLRGSDGRVEALLGVTRDITERKEAEDALRRARDELEQRVQERTAELVGINGLLRESERRLQHAFDVGGMGSWERNLETGEIRWDDRVYRIFGIEPGTKVDLSATFFAMVHPEDLATVKKTLELTEQTGAPYRCEYRAIKPDGKIIWIHADGGLRHGADGLATHIAGINFDITERKRAEEELRILTAKLDLRVAERTQELANSRARLRALVAELERAEERERRRLAAELHDYLAQMLSVTRMTLDRARRFARDGELKDLLTEARSAMDRSIDYTRTLIAELSPRVLYDLGLPPALQWLAEQMRRHGLEVTIEGSDELPLGEDQAILVFQCVRELLWNVVKHANTDSARVSYRLENGCLLLSVSDEGRGFAAAATADKADLPTGFGLFSIRERFELQGGKFKVESRPMKGTRVDLTLPVAPNEELVGRQKAAGSEGQANLLR
jgi:PAS domain S-box-containing protein